jgi:hypothetical protein
MTARAPAPSSSWPPEDVLTVTICRKLGKGRMNLLDLDVFLHKPAGTR